MDSLMSAHIVQISSCHAKRHNQTFLPATSTRFIESLHQRPIKMMKSFKLANSSSSSIQPVESFAAQPFDNTMPTKEVLDLWRNVEAVCFDVDNTVCVDEGIDEFAEFCGDGKAVAEWTSKSSNEWFSHFPRGIGCEAVINKSIPGPTPGLPPEEASKRLSPGIADLVKKLKPVASILEIPLENIFANQLLFGNSGEFLGFDENEPTSRSGGKAVAVQQIRKAHGYKILTMIGDGATDLEASQPDGADWFICYGGVQLRHAVAAKADWLVFKFDDLINSLD